VTKTTDNVDFCSTGQIFQIWAKFLDRKCLEIVGRDIIIASLMSILSPNHSDKALMAITD